MAFPRPQSWLVISRISVLASLSHPLLSNPSAVCRWPFLIRPSPAPFPLGDSNSSFKTPLRPHPTDFCINWACFCFNFQHSMLWLCLLLFLSVFLFFSLITGLIARTASSPFELLITKHASYLMVDAKFTFVGLKRNECLYLQYNSLTQYFVFFPIIPQLEMSSSVIYCCLLALGSNINPLRISSVFSPHPGIVFPSSLPKANLTNLSRFNLNPSYFSQLPPEV